jgi:hypothetical protein
MNAATGQPYINPCTGQPYLYGQIFDPTTQQVVAGQTCASPFPGNVIPTRRAVADAVGVVDESWTAEIAHPQSKADNSALKG